MTRVAVAPPDVVDCSLAQVSAARLRGMRSKLASDRMPLVPAPALHGPLWGFFWSDCVYEAGLMLQSLHRSKIGALRAMIAAQAARWEDCRSGAGSCLHLYGCGTFAARDYRDRRASEAYAVRLVEVLP